MRDRLNSIANKCGVKGLDPAFYNQDQLAYYRQKILRQDMKPRGIRGSIASIFELNQDIEEDFFINVDMRSKDSNIITMQTPYEGSSARSHCGIAVGYS